jgi:phage virion morphogenesis protein
MAVNDDVIAQINTVFNDLKNRFTPNKNLMSAIAGHLHASVMERFAQQGPGWPPLKASTLKYKSRKGMSARILEATGMLQRSIQPGASENEAWAATNLVYAAIHHFGGTIHQGARSELFTRNRYKKVGKTGQFKKGTSPGKGMSFKERVIKIPPRPFMVLTEGFAEKIIAEIRKQIIA